MINGILVWTYYGCNRCKRGNTLAFALDSIRVSCAMWSDEWFTGLWCCCCHGWIVIFRFHFFHSFTSSNDDEGLSQTVKNWCIRLLVLILDQTWCLESLDLKPNWLGDSEHHSSSHLFQSKSAANRGGHGMMSSNGNDRWAIARLFLQTRIFNCSKNDLQV